MRLRDNSDRRSLCNAVVRDTTGKHSFQSAPASHSRAAQTKVRATLAIVLCLIVSTPAAAQQKSDITRESTRHDFDTQFTNFTIFNAAATYKQLRQLFKYEFAGLERLGDQDLMAVRFEQIEFRKDLFGLRHYEKLNVTGPLMRGQYWLDPQTGQVRREHHEIFFRDNTQPRTFKAIEADYDFTTGGQGIWLPQRILFQVFNPLKWDKGFPVEMFLNVRMISEYGPFRRFEVKARQENVPQQ